MDPPRHDEQHAILPLCDGLDRRIDRIDLVVARCLCAAIVVVVLQDDLLGNRKRRTALIECLETFMEAGWPAARRLLYRLPELIQ